MLVDFSLKSNFISFW